MDAANRTSLRSATRSMADLDRAARLLKKKYKQYRDYEFDEAIALRIERLTSWGL